MSLFDKKTVVYGPQDVTVGEFDPTVDGFYRTVVTIPLDVKPKHMLYVKVTSDNPIDVVIANDEYSSIAHKNGITDVLMGPFPTGDSNSMGILLGIFRGDLAHVEVEAWME